MKEAILVFVTETERKHEIDQDIQ